MNLFPRKYLDYPRDVQEPADGVAVFSSSGEADSKWQGFAGGNVETDAAQSRAKTDAQRLLTTIGNMSKRAEEHAPFELASDLCGNVIEVIDHPPTIENVSAVEAEEETPAPQQRPTAQKENKFESQQPTMEETSAIAAEESPAPQQKPTQQQGLKFNPVLRR